MELGSQNKCTFTNFNFVSNSIILKIDFRLLVIELSTKWYKKVRAL